MTPLDELLAERACERLILTYARAVDDCDIPAFLAIFTDDAVWHRPGLDPINGAKAIEKEARERFIVSLPGQRMTHHVTNLQVWVGGDVARSHAYSVAYKGVAPAGRETAPTGSLLGIVAYNSSFRRTPSGWRIASHQSRPIFD